jgi:hypothetical protein
MACHVAWKSTSVPSLSNRMPLIAILYSACRLWTWATSPLVELSRPAADALPSTIGSRPVASSLPSSTPHWSKALMPKSAPRRRRDARRARPAGRARTDRACGRGSSPTGRLPENTRCGAISSICACGAALGHLGRASASVRPFISACDCARQLASSRSRDGRPDPARGPAATMNSTGMTSVP